MKSTFLNLLAAAVLGLVPMALSAQVPAYVPTDGLVGWWPFNGNANDESGNGNDGVVNGATLTEDRFGNANSCFSFDGYNDEIRIQHQTILNLEGDFSITGWYKTSEFPATSNSHTIIAKRDDNLSCCSPQVPYDLAVNYQQNSTDYRKPLLAFANGNYHFCQSDSSLALDEWTNISLTYSIDTCRIYVNGIMAHSALFPSNFRGANSSDLLIGSINRAYGDEYMNGQLDDIAIYNRALTEQEIQNLYTGTTPVACTALPANLQNGLVGYWPFCGNANDESGNGNDGVVNGATLTEDRFGNANAAYGFDGVDDNVEIVPNNLTIDSVFSVSLWLNKVPKGENRFLSFERAGAPDGYQFRFGMEEGIHVPDNGKLYFHSGIAGVGTLPWNNSTGFELTSETAISNDLWQHALVVKDGINFKLYLNGSLQASVDASINLDFTGNPNTVLLGAVYEAFSSNTLAHLQGSLDDLTIWNRALTPAEVQELYTLDACTFTVYDTLTVENIINVYDTLTIENIVDIYDTTYINVELYDTLTVENVINVYDTLTIENIVEVYDTLTVENVIDVFDTTTVVETVVVFDTLTVENVIDVFDTTTVVETVVVFDTLTVENVFDVYDTTYVTVTDTLIIDIPSGVGGTILNTLLLYPNPTSDQLTINYGNFAAMAGYSLSIFDNGGSTVHETNITQAQETLDITQWSAGVYQVVVYNAGGVPVETRQIVIQ